MLTYHTEHCNLYVLGGAPGNSGLSTSVAERAPFIVCATVLLDSLACIHLSCLHRS